MTSYARATVLALTASATLAVAAPAAQAAFGPETSEAGTCVNHTCTYPSVEANPKEAFTQAAGHPPWGITRFVMKHSGSSIEGASVRRIRVDVPPGLASNPQAPMPVLLPPTFPRPKPTLPKNAYIAAGGPPPAHSFVPATTPV